MQTSQDLNNTNFHVKRRHNLIVHSLNTYHFKDRILIAELGLGSCRVRFVFGLNLNGLKTSEPELDLFNKRVEKPQPKPLKT